MAPVAQLATQAITPARRATSSLPTWVRSWPEPLRVGLTLLTVIALSVGIVLAPIDYRALGNLGYLGVFLVTLAATAALILPLPYIGVIVVAGSFLNPALVALVAGLAAGIGELTGYVLGATGRALLPQYRWMPRLEHLVRRFGIPVIFAASLIPNPLFDAVGLIAGAIRLPIWAFVLPCMAGKALRFWLFASFGGWLPG